MLLTELLAEIDSSLYDIGEIDPSSEVRGIAIDSRKVEPGDLFIAIPGTNVDGAKYLDEAKQKGASILVSSEKASNSLYTSNPREFAAKIASAYYRHPSKELRSIAITGTNGKSSVCWLIAKALAKLDYLTLRTGTLGTYIEKASEAEVLDASTLTTPDAISIQKSLAHAKDYGVQFLVSEVSSHSLEQYRTASICWDLAIYTNLSRDHLDYHGSMESYAESKSLLFSRELAQSSKLKKIALLNFDNQFSKALKGAEIPNAQVLSYSRAGDDRADIFLGNSKSTLEGIELEIHFANSSTSISSSLLGAYNLENLLSAFSALYSLILSGKISCSIEDLAAVLSEVENVPGRMQCFSGDSGVKVVVDYAHTPDALQSVLKALKELNPNRIITVFGCGGDRDRGKRSEMGQEAAALSDYYIVTNDNPRTEDPQLIAEDILSGVKGNAKGEVILDRKEAISAALQIAKPNDFVLVAGKGHEDYQEVNGKRTFFSDEAVVNELLEANG